MTEVGKGRGMGVTLEESTVSGTVQQAGNRRAEPLRMLGACPARLPGLLFALPPGPIVTPPPPPAMLEGARQFPGSVSLDSRLTLVSLSPGAWAQKADSLGLSPDSTSLTAYAVLLTLHR